MPAAKLRSARGGALFPGGALGDDDSRRYVAGLAQVERFCRERGVELVVVGPEAPLVAGLADSLTAAGIECDAPTALCPWPLNFLSAACSRRRLKIQGVIGFHEEPLDKEGSWYSLHYFQLLMCNFISRSLFALPVPRGREGWQVSVACNDRKISFRQCQPVPEEGQAHSAAFQVADLACNAAASKVQQRLPCMAGCHSCSNDPVGAYKSVSVCIGLVTRGGRRGRFGRMLRPLSLKRPGRPAACSAQARRRPGWRAPRSF